MKNFIFLVLASFLFQWQSVALAEEVAPVPVPTPSPTPAPSPAPEQSVKFDCTYPYSEKNGTTGHLVVTLDSTETDDMNQTLRAEATNNGKPSPAFVIPTISEGGKFGINIGFTVTWSMDLFVATSVITLEDMFYGESFQKPVFGYSQYNDDGSPIISKITTMTCTMAAAPAAPAK